MPLADGGHKAAAAATAVLGVSHLAGSCTVDNVRTVITGRALIGLFVEGRLRSRVQQETSGTWPTPSGVSCRAQTVEVDEDLAARATALLTALGWSGLAELQYLRDDDGRRWLIDLNGRFYGSMALANAAGANLADAWARSALGRPLPSLPDGRPGVRFL